MMLSQIFSEIANSSVSFRDVQNSSTNVSEILKRFATEASCIEAFRVLRWQLERQSNEIDIFPNQGITCFPYKHFYRPAGRVDFIRFLKGYFRVGCQQSIPLSSFGNFAEKELNECVFELDDDFQK